MKKLRYILLLTAIFISVYRFQSLTKADENCITAVSVQTVDGSVGDTVTVKVNATNAVRLDSIQFNINYDGSSLKPLSFTPGLVFTPEYCVLNLDEPNRIRAACVNAFGAEWDGELFEVSFQILSDSGSAITLSDVVATQVDADYHQFPAYVTIENGGVSVSGKPLPEPKVTPWIAPTPIPTPTPEVTPTPIPEPIALPQETPIPSPTPELEMETENERHLMGNLAVAGLCLIVAGIITGVIIADHRKQKTVLKKRKRQNEGKA